MKKEELRDWLGNPLKVGDVVVYSYRTQTYEPFFAGIYTGSTPKTLRIAIKSRKFDSKTYSWTDTISYSNIKKEMEDMQAVIVVSNPLFSLSNKKISEMMVVTEMLKTARVLPEDFVFGQSANEF